MGINSQKNLHDTSILATPPSSSMTQKPLPSTQPFECTVLLHVSQILIHSEIYQSYNYLDWVPITITYEMTGYSA